MELSRQEYWSGLSFLTPGDLPDPGIKPESLVSPALAGRFFATVLPGKPRNDIGKLINKVSCPMFLAQWMQEWIKLKSQPFMGLTTFWWGRRQLTVTALIKEMTQGEGS